MGFNTVNGKYYCNYIRDIFMPFIFICGFNTVNGKYYCNRYRKIRYSSNSSRVSIP